MTYYIIPCLVELALRSPMSRWSSSSELSSSPLLPAEVLASRSPAEMLDPRPPSPMVLLRSLIARCGEQSARCAGALRWVWWAECEVCWGTEVGVVSGVRGVPRHFGGCGGRSARCAGTLRWVWSLSHCDGVLRCVECDERWKSCSRYEAIRVAFFTAIVLL